MFSNSDVKFIDDTCSMCCLTTGNVGNSSSPKVKSTIFGTPQKQCQQTDMYRPKIIRLSLENYCPYVQYPQPDTIKHKND